MDAGRTHNGKTTEENNVWGKHEWQVERMTWRESLPYARMGDTDEEDNKDTNTDATERDTEQDKKLKHAETLQTEATCVK